MSSEALERRKNLWERVQLLRANEFDAALEVGEPQFDWSDAYAEDVPWLLAEVARLEQALSLLDRNATVWHADDCGVHNANPPWRCTCDGQVLREQVARLEQELAIVERVSQRNANAHMAVHRALAVAREREQRLREALAFYANQPNAHGAYSDVLEDGGDRARAALVDENPMGPSGEPAAASAPDPATLSVTQGGIGDTAGFFLPPAAADEPGETP